MALSIVVPVYNSEASLELLVGRIHASLGTCLAPIELILVNDCSRDRSWEVIEKLQTCYPWVRGINLVRNFGQHNALLCGIRAARYPLTVTMDDDLQNPPEEVPKLVDKLRTENADVVYGTPQRESHGLWRDLASMITKLVLQHAMGAATARNVSAFRCLRTGLREAFADYGSPYVSIDVLLTWGTRRFASVPVRNEPRPYGTSNYTVRKLAVHAMNMMTGFSTLPLQFASMAGFGFMLFGLLVLAYVIGRFVIQGAVVPGFAFLASIVAIFSGTQLFALGVIGEYIARMHVRSMGQPSYVVKQANGD
jgi:undecaprenyl-phosphate 4-deoxy-4-formamido-L-arabinose transferase